MTYLDKRVLYMFRECVYKFNYLAVRDKMHSMRGSKGGRQELPPVNSQDNQDHPLGFHRNNILAPHIHTWKK